ncbi:nucleoside transporter-domain-containing protein [Lipomyces arxii]|uniref:nucleoside transporter-domain-containing protein n=1 Tax=Lipomyces arxii TaxID=56418 RepID=UPI0034CEC9F8
MAGTTDPAGKMLLQTDERSAPPAYSDRAEAWPASSSMESQDLTEEDLHNAHKKAVKENFDLAEYVTFLLLGIAMLWPWNCFLSAAAYFQERFESSIFLKENFQSCMMTTSTVTGVIAMLILSNQQRKAKYTFRIWIALVMNIINFGILAISAIAGRTWAIGPYFVYLMISVFFSSLATAFSQNGAFAIANLFAPIYTQGIMVGQAVAGVLPSIAQILAVVSVDATRVSPDAESSSSARSSFIYFLTASIITAVALFFYLNLYRRHTRVLNHVPVVLGITDGPDPDSSPVLRRHVSLITLFKKLHFLSISVFYTFGLTLMFPVFASNVLSVNYTEGVSSPSSWARPAVFIPFAFLIWNVGDLVGRLICGYPQFVMKNPKSIVLFSASRTIFLPAFFLCNINGSGAAFSSDFFYMLLQLLFGISNGYNSSCSMMGAESFVEEDEKEAAGGFMGLSLNLGLAAGSILSFILVASIE